MNEERDFDRTHRITLLEFHRVFRLGPLLISRTSWYSRERKLFMAANDIVFQ